MSNAFHRYSQKLSECLATYQFIEHALRSCLVRFHATVSFRLKGYLPYEIPLDAIDDAALGTLTKWFKSYSSNVELVRELDSIKKERDRIAHRGYVLSVEEQADGALLIQKTEELEAAHLRAQACYAKLHTELELAEKLVQRASMEIQSQNGDKPAGL